MRIGVMQMVDSLILGGAERMGVTLANLLPRDRFDSYLCVTRMDGPLSGFVAGDVNLLRLNRRGPIGISALRRLSAFMQEKNIRIIHAHASSLFFARLASAFPPYPKVVWHDHYGRCELNDRPAWLYGLATKGIDAIITVNEMLSQWATNSLGVPPARVTYIRNGVEIPDSIAPAKDLPGIEGKRIVCVANIRPQKDHPTLLRAMDIVRQKDPSAHLLLVGGATDEDANYASTVIERISEMGLSAHVSHLGRRADTSQILKASDVGVLSSVSEGLPLVLLEYGACSLPVVCTAVGQCPEVLDNGKAGVLVPPSAPDQLARELINLLESVERRRAIGALLRDRVQNVYGAASTISQVCAVYDTLLGGEPLPELSARTPSSELPKTSRQLGNRASGGQP